MANDININFNEPSGGGPQGGSYFDGSSIAELKKAIDDFAAHLKEFPNTVNKAFGSTGNSNKTKELNDLETQLLRQQINNAQQEEILLKRKVDNQDREHQSTQNNNKLFQRGLELFIGSQLLNRVGNIAGNAITSNPIGNPVQRATSIASNIGGSIVDTLGIGATAIGGPLAGALTYGLGTLINDVYTGFKGQEEQTAYNKYFLNSSYRTRGIAESRQYDPNKDPYFAQVGAVAAGYASAGGSINMKQANLISSLGQKLGINPTDTQSFSNLGNIVGQFGDSIGDLTTTVKTIKSYQENYGGDPIARLQTALSLYQNGAVTTQQAFNMAYQNPDFGSAFAQRATQFTTSPYIQRFQQETLAKALTGVDLEQLYSGTPAQQNAQAAKLRSVISKTNFSTEQFNPQAFALSFAGVNGPGAINDYVAKDRNTNLLNSPTNLKNFDPATQSALNAQHAVVTIKNAVLNVKQANQMAKEIDKVNKNPKYTPLEKMYYNQAISIQPGMF